MEFDWQNFGIGLGVGWASAYGVYRARNLIRSGVETARSGASQARNYATRSADSRYINDLITVCERSHLAGRFAKLSDLLIEPRFIGEPELIGYVEEITRSVFRVVPRIWDHPFLHAPYNIETVSVPELVTGEQRLALLGNPGSGRTTALMALILWTFDRVEFKQPVDRVQERLNEEEALLDDEKRAKRIKDRVNIEERAKERLAKEKGKDYIDDGAGESRIEAFRRRMPIYIHLANITLSTDEFGATVDPAEPLVRGVQAQFGRVTGMSIPGYIYTRLAEGRAAVLIDGYDDLPEAERDSKLAWAKALIETYPDNFFLVVGPAHGYGVLTQQLGLTPVFIRPWNDVDDNLAANAWADHWDVIGGSRRNRVAKPDERQIRRAASRNRALPIFDTILKIWGTYADQDESSGFEQWLNGYITRYLPAKESLDALLPKLSRMAALQLDEGYITDANMAETMNDLFVVDGEAGAAPASDDPSLTDLAQAPAKPKGAKDPKTVESEKSKQRARLLAALRKSGLLMRYRGERYQFRHIFLASYLAGMLLRDAGSELLADIALNPIWSQAIAYASLHTDIEVAVQTRLNAPQDILQTHALEAARWLAYAPANVTWREPLLRQLGTAFIAPNQFPLTRERLAAGLVGTREKNVYGIFKRALNDSNADVRRLACLGLGALNESEAIAELSRLLQDPDNDVQLAAGLALGAIGTPEALEEMALALTQGSEQLRKAVAEAFAAVPEEGFPVLFDAINHEEMNVRRAAVFGLRRVPTTWALVAVYRASLEDDQWYVRSAAQEAFLQMSLSDIHGPQAYPPPNKLEWLDEWAKKHGQELNNPQVVDEALITALRQGEPQEKVYSATAFGQYGMVEKAKLLYTALRDRHEGVRAAAHRALGEIALRVGAPLPSPV